MNLDHDAEVILWSQGVFGLTEGGLESLVDRADIFDFAVLVLTPDDLTESRELTKPSPRDNVIFELGLFMGSLGRLRTFIVFDRTADLKLPSDLAGVTPATYAPPTVGTLQSALGAPSTQILSAIQARGKREDKTALPEIDPHMQFRVIAGLLEPGAWEFFILMNETGASLRREDFGMLGTRFEYSIRTAVQQGDGRGYFGTNKLCERLADAGLLTVDLRGRVSLSERGRAFAEWLAESGYKAQYFWSDIGSWGNRPDEFFGGARHESDAPRNFFHLKQNSSNSNNPPPEDPEA